MILKGQNFKISQLFFLMLYYAIARWLPKSGNFLNIGGAARRWCCKYIFKKCGRNINVERGAFFGKGILIELGDYSGIGINANIPGDTIIGDYVMMGPNVTILPHNHEFRDISIPMMLQGNTPKVQTIIGNDVWIGQNVIMTPGRKILDGTIIGAGCILTKDFPEYSIVGGNPSKLLKSRK